MTTADTDNVLSPESGSSRDDDNPAWFYEEYWVPAVHGPYADDLLDRAAPRPGERILDVACGTGVVARKATRRLNGNARITGLDINPGMLEVSRSQAADEGAEITWIEGGAEALPFDDGSVDLVLCQQALQLVPDGAKAVREMYRVLRSGGRAATSTWTSIENHPFDVLIADAMQRHLGAPSFDAAFSLGDPEKLAALFHEAGFEDVEIEVVNRETRFPSPGDYIEMIVVGSVASIPSVQDMNETDRAGLISAIRAELAESAQSFIVEDALVLPAPTAILLARKPNS